MPCPSHLPRLYQFNYTWRRGRVMKLLIMQFAPTSCYFIRFWSKYSPRDPVLKPQSVFLPECQRPSFTPMQNHRQNYSCVLSRV
jgi:hypothetical protein